MSEVMKDPVIKLFGKTISLPSDRAVSDVTADSDQKQSSSATPTSSGDSKDVSGGEFKGTKHDNDSYNPTDETMTIAATSSGISDDTEIPEKDSLSQEASLEEEPTESSASQEKTLTKPVKILPCPRCNSMDTKFCYFNNYNVNQPRYFCKNCQRYWTAGGTMRNVPVGSGRRKTKSSVVQNCQHILVSDAFSLKQNGFILIGSDRTFGEPMMSTLNLPEPSNNCTPNESREHSTSTTPNSLERGENADAQASQVPCFPQPSWPSNWNSAHWSSPQPPAFSPSGFPLSFFRATPYWGQENPWNRPWITPTSPISSALGKHSREGTILRPSNLEINSSPKKVSAERTVLTPKTLRIDDPSEAAKSSIWSALGIKNETTMLNKGGSLFKTFDSKAERNIDADNKKMVLQANPAALSRSVRFQESA